MNLTATAAPPRGKLEWPLLLGWLRDDGYISAEDANRVTARFRAGASSAWVAPASCTGAVARRWIPRC